MCYSFPHNSPLFSPILFGSPSRFLFSFCLFDLFLIQANHFKWMYHFFRGLVGSFILANVFFLLLFDHPIRSFFWNFFFSIFSFVRSVFSTQSSSAFGTIHFVSFFFFLYFRGLRLWKILLFFLRHFFVVIQKAVFLSRLQCIVSRAATAIHRIFHIHTHIHFFNFSFHLQEKMNEIYFCHMWIVGEERELFNKNWNEMEFLWF